MPGRPIRRKMIADIREQGGLEIAVFDRLRDGETLSAMPNATSESTAQPSGDTSTAIRLGMQNTSWPSAKARRI